MYLLFKESVHKYQLLIYYFMITFEINCLQLLNIIF